MRGVELQRAAEHLARLVGVAGLLLRHAELIVEIDALGHGQRVRVVHEDGAERLERGLPLLAREVVPRATALRIEVRRIDLGRLRIRLLRLVGLTEHRRGLAEAREALELNLLVGGLAREHLEDRHEIGVALRVPQQLCDALAGLDVVGIDLQRLEVELGGALVIVEAVVDLAGLDEEARPLQPVLRVRHGLDEQLARLQELAVLAVELDHAGHRRHVSLVGLEHASEARLGALRVALQHRELARVVQELDLVCLRLGGRGAAVEQLGRLDPHLCLLVEARELLLRRGVVRQEALGLRVRLDRAVRIAQLVVGDLTDLREHLGAQRGRDDRRVAAKRLDERLPVALDSIDAGERAQRVFRARIELQQLLEVLRRAARARRVLFPLARQAPIERGALAIAVDGVGLRGEHGEQLLVTAFCLIEALERAQCAEIGREVARQRLEALDGASAVAHALGERLGGLATERERLLARRERGALGEHLDEILPVTTTTQQRLERGVQLVVARLRGDRGAVCLGRAGAVAESALEHVGLLRVAIAALAVVLLRLRCLTERVGELFPALGATEEADAQRLRLDRRGHRLGARRAEEPHGLRDGRERVVHVTEAIAVEARDAQPRGATVVLGHRGHDLGELGEELVPRARGRRQSLELVPRVRARILAVRREQRGERLAEIADLRLEEPRDLEQHVRAALCVALDLGAAEE